MIRRVTVPISCALAVLGCAFLSAGVLQPNERPFLGCYRLTPSPNADPPMDSIRLTVDSQPSAIGWTVVPNYRWWRDTRSWTPTWRVAKDTLVIGAGFLGGWTIRFV